MRVCEKCEVGIICSKCYGIEGFPPCAFQLYNKLLCSNCEIKKDCNKAYDKGPLCLFKTTKQKKYCITIKGCEQVSPDDYETIYRNFECTGNTKVSEIIEWAKSVNTNATRITGLQLNEMDEAK